MLSDSQDNNKKRSFVFQCTCYLYLKIFGFEKSYRNSLDFHGLTVIDFIIPYFVDSYFRQLFSALMKTRAFATLL